MRTSVLLSSLALWMSIAALAGCGSKSSPDDGTADAASPQAYLDSLIQLSSVSARGSHILETRIHPDGRVLYCSARRGLTVVDASDPGSLREEATLFSSVGGQRCQHLALAGDTVYVTNRGSDLAPTPFIAAFDLGQALDPAPEIATFTHPSFTFEGIVAVGDMIYVAVHGDGVAVLQNTGAATLQLRGTVDTPGNAWGIAASGTTLYVADGPGGVVIVDAADPDNPRLRGTLAPGDDDGAAQSIVHDPGAGIAYVANGTALLAIDVSDPDAPVEIGRAVTPGSAVAVTLDDSPGTGSPGRAYVADWNDARVFDISDIAAIRASGQIPLLATERISTEGMAFTRVLGIAGRGDHVFVGEWDALYAYEFHPDRPAPDIRVTGTTFDFGDVSVGDRDAVAVIVHNEGQAPLVIDSARMDDPSFTVSPGSMTIDPGQAGVFEVTFAPTSASGLDARLILSSDDPDESRRDLEVLGNLPGLGVGSTAPEVAVELLDGGNWLLSENLGSPVLLAYFATF